MSTPNPVTLPNAESVNKMTHDAIHEASNTKERATRVFLRNTITRTIIEAAKNGQFECMLKVKEDLDFQLIKSELTSMGYKVFITSARKLHAAAHIAQNNLYDNDYDFINRTFVETTIEIKWK
jgi:hypothetical protein